MAMLMEVSSNISMISPKNMTAERLRPNDPEFGSRHITATATAAPINK